MITVSTWKQGERELMFTIIFAELTVGCQVTSVKKISLGRAKNSAWPDYGRDRGDRRVESIGLSTAFGAGDERG